MVGFTGNQITKPPRIFTGTVFEIYPEVGEIDVKVAYPDNRFYERVPYSSTFKDKGLAGFDFVPTRGCSVLLLEHASEDSGGAVSLPLVLGFMAPPGKSIGARRELLPSDVQVNGKYGNNLLLRSNGDAYLVGDSRNLIAFITTEELTKLRTSNYEHEHQGGRVRWMVDGDAQGGAVAYLHTIKRKASDDKPYLSISAGTNAAGGLEIRMASEGGELTDVANPAFINDVPLGCAFKFSSDMEGNVGVSTLGTMSVESLGVMNLTSGSAVNIGAPQITFTSALGGISLVSAPGQPTKVILPEGLEIITPKLSITQGTESLVQSTNDDKSKKVITEDLFDWIINHRHLHHTLPLQTYSGSVWGLSTKPLNSSAIDTDDVYNSIMFNVGGFGTDLVNNIPQATLVQGLLLNEEQQYTADKDTALSKKTKVR
jgi:hypothetical protein